MAIPPKATPLEGIRLTETTEDNAAPNVLVQNAEGVICYIPKSSITVITDPIPTTGSVNTVQSGGVKTYVDTGLSLKENVSKKVQNLNSPSDTTYPSTQAVRDYVNSVAKTYIHRFYKIPTPITGTTAEVEIFRFPIPALYVEKRKLRITAKLYCTGTGGTKHIGISAGSEHPSIKNIVHNVGGNANMLPAEREIVFYEDKYNNIYNSGLYFTDRTTPFPSLSVPTEFDATVFKSPTNIIVSGTLMSASDSIFAAYVTIEIFDQNE